VESIPKKLKQNRPKTAFLIIVVRKFGHRMILFGHRFLPRQESPKSDQIRPPYGSIRPPNLTDRMHYFWVIFQHYI